jgi:hypothetical protein
VDPTWVVSSDDRHEDVLEAAECDFREKLEHNMTGTVSAPGMRDFTRQ